MRSKYTKYNFNDSIKRVENILSETSLDYTFRQKIPIKSKLGYTDGCYIDVCALFIDIRGSSNLTIFHRRPTLAKLYRAFISESVEILRSNKNCKELSIRGDCVFGVFEGIDNKSVSKLFNTAICLNTFIYELNYLYNKHDICSIDIGIGIDCGRSLLVKAGSLDNMITELIWMGNVVNNACHLASKGSKDVRESIVISRNVYDKLSSYDQNYCNGAGLFNHDYYVTNMTFDEI